MKLLVKRLTKTSLSVTGELWVDGKFQCYTLEPPEREQGVKPRTIPLGTYDVTIRQSHKFARLMPHVENVPDFEGILIHPGNFPSDTEGCLLVGRTVGPNPDYIGESKHAFDPLFLALQDSGPHTITYIESLRGVQHP